MNQPARKAQAHAAEPASDELVLVAIDDGYAETKLVANGVQLSVPSIARAGTHGVLQINEDVKNSVRAYAMENGETFTVGDGIEGERTQFDSYPYSTLNRAIVQHALQLAGFGGRRVRVATGLPLEQFYENLVPSARRIRDKKANLAQPVSILGKGKAAVIVQQDVYSEAVAACIDFYLDDEGRPRDVSWPIAIVDIGGRTTDIATILDGENIDMQRSGTATLGVLDLYRDLDAGLRTAFSLSSPLSQQIVRNALTTGTVRLFNEVHDVATHVAASRSHIEEALKREIDRRIGSGAELAAVVFVGGGARVFEGLPKLFAHSSIPDAPEFANARGMYKFMKHLQNG